MGQASGNGTKRNCLGARRSFRNWGQTGRAIKLATTAVLDPERILNEQCSELARWIAHRGSQSKRWCHIAIGNRGGDASRLADEYGTSPAPRSPRSPHPHSHPTAAAVLLCELDQHKWSCRQTQTCTLAQCRPGRPIGQSTLQRDQMILRYGLIRSRSIAMLIIATHC